MRYVPPVLIQYRYPILAFLSLLLILQLVGLADISSVPIEYEWVSGWTLLITMVAWTGIAGVVGIGAPVRGEVLKRGGHIILILSSALFATSIFSPILGATLFQSAFLLDLFWQPHLLLFLIVWIGIVVVVGATSDAATARKIYLRIGVFLLLVATSSGILWTAVFSMDIVEGLLEPLVSTDLLDDLIILLGALFILLSNSLVIGAVVLRSTLDVHRVVVAIIALGVSIVAFGSAIGVGILLFFLPYSGYGEPPPASAVNFYCIRARAVVSHNFCVWYHANWDGAPSYSGYYGSRSRYGGNDSGSCMVFALYRYLGDILVIAHNYEAVG